MRLLIGSLILSVFVGSAGADSCRNQVVIRHRAAVVHHAHHTVAAVVTPIPVAQFVPFAVQVPTYSVGVAPQQQLQQPDAVAQAIEKLALAVERIGSGPQVLQSQALQAPQALQASAHLRILTSRCASCHDAATSKVKGGGLTLLDGGKEVQLTPRQILRVLATTHDGSMPKSGAKLNATEKQVVSQWIESLTQ